MTQTLIVGGNSIIGSALFDRLAHAHSPVIKTTRRHAHMSKDTVLLNLAEPSNWSLPEQIDTAIICAGQTSTHQCQLEPEHSRAINVINTVDLAKRLIDSGGRVIFLSSNLVYDGAVPFRKSSDKACPKSEYGRQKAETERALLNLGEAVCIVRLTKVISQNTAIVKQWWQALKHGEEIQPFSDMVLAPIPLNFVVDALVKLVDKPYTGIIQISGQADISYETFAKQLAKHLGADRKLIKPTSWRQQQGKFTEEPPIHTTLDTSDLEAQLQMSAPNLPKCFEGMLSGAIKLSKIDSQLTTKG